MSELSVRRSGVQCAGVNARLGWGKPLLIAVGGAVGYYVLAMGIFFVAISGM